MSNQLSDNNKRIAKNTLLLYFRMLFLMVIGLFTSRINLQALGVQDFGIYNVVGGVVVMFNILSTSLSSAISRFLTYELGAGNKERLKHVFSSGVTIQILLAILFVLLAETLGLWFVNTHLVIPEDRIEATNWVLQFSILTFAINLISVPYNASIISHEKMAAFAYISIFEVIGKLLIAYGTFVSPIDKLIFFSGMTTLIAVLLRVIYGWYCKKNFEECSYKFIFDSSLLKKMFSFAGWNFIGASSAVLRDQGGNIIINLFYGPSVNAARGIAMQVNNAVQGFVNNFQTAINPQITKNYASGNYQYMMNLVFKGAKFSFFILLIMSLPIMITTPYLLFLWLGQVPEHTVNFVRLILLFTLSESLAGPLITAMLATGNIKKYQIVVGGLQMLNLPISYLCLKMGLPPEIVLVVAIIISICCEFTRLFMLKNMINISIFAFLKEVYCKSLLVFAISFGITYWLNSKITPNMISFIIISICSILITCTFIYIIGLNNEERLSVRKFVLTKLNIYKYDKNK